MKARYEAALSPLTASGDRVELRFIVAGGLSSAYQQLAQQMSDAKGRILDKLFKHYPAPSPIESYATINLVTYSAGYAFARVLLANASDAARITSYVALDSIHASYESPTKKKPLPAHLAPFVAYAEKARAGLTRFWLGHSDVKTSGYASTTEVAAALSASPGVGGNFNIRSYNVAADPRAEHAAALTQWGPSFVAEALIPWLSAQGAIAEPAPIPADAWRDPGLPLGLRAVLFAKNEMARGVTEEPPGSNGGMRIREYLAPCVRDGKKLNMKAGEWCAAAACFSAQQALLPGESIPHDYRISGIEIERDLGARGAYRTLAQVLDGSFVPEAGDLVILKRGTQAWQRHVCRVVEIDVAGKTMVTIGGNEDDHWKLTKRNLASPVLGFGEMPGLVTRSVVRTVPDARLAGILAKMTARDWKAASRG